MSIVNIAAAEPPPLSSPKLLKSYIRACVIIREIPSWSSCKAYPFITVVRSLIKSWPFFKRPLIVWYTLGQFFSNPGFVHRNNICSCSSIADAKSDNFKKGKRKSSRVTLQHLLQRDISVDCVKEMIANDECCCLFNLKEISPIVYIQREWTSGR